jgi:antagonist of KipI
MQINILKPGLHTSIQDLGRTAYSSQAVPISGAMDTLSARIANLVIGNLQTDAVLELSYGNAAFMCETDVLISYAGAGSTLTVSNQKLPSKRPIFLPAGTLAELVNHEPGVRTYLAIGGGWEVPVVLGSRSTYLPAAFGGYRGRLLKKGDVLTACDHLSRTGNEIFNHLLGKQPKYTLWGVPDRVLTPADVDTIRIFPGREINWFEPNSIISLLENTFQIDLKSNRMGSRLKGPLMHKIVTEELLSTAVCPGTIQVTGSGEMVLLLADCQTTGGYPRIAQVAAVDLPLCAQLKPNDQITFSLISLAEAEALYYEQEAELCRLAQAIHVKHKF